MRSSRKARAAGGVLDVGNIVRCWPGQGFFVRGQRVEGFGHIHHAHGQRLAGLLEERQIALTGDTDSGITGLEQALKLRHIGLVPADFHRCRQRHGNQAGILAGKEKADEIRIGLGDQRHAITARHAKPKQFVRQIDGLLTQFPIADTGVDSAAAGVIVGSGRALRGVVERLGQSGEVGGAKRQLVAGWCGAQMYL